MSAVATLPKNKPDTLAAMKMLMFPSHTPGAKKGLSPIMSRLTHAEALKLRQSWEPPAHLEGEFVWYRSKNAREEMPGILVECQGKGFTIFVYHEGRPSNRVLGVAYYDPTRLDVSDPVAAFASNGCFRKSCFSKFFFDMMSQSIEVSVKDFENRLKIMEDKLSRVPDLSDAHKALERVALAEARMNELAAKLGELTTAVEAKPESSLHQRIAFLESQNAEIIKALGGTVEEAK